MSRPVIGITVESKFDPEDPRTRGKLELNWNYAEAVTNAGGLPIVIPPVADMDQVATMIDGWLIPGGLDIDAKHFGQTNHPKNSLQDESRYEAEQSLFRQVSPDLPILGVCYGCQFLNVVEGGSLIQHLPDHPVETHTGGVSQAYRLEPSRLATFVGSQEVAGKSYHHQAIDEVAASLRVVGRSEDGVIEAVEAVDRPWVIGVQWHPERTQDDPAMARLFREFVAAASAYREKRTP